MGIIGRMGKIGGKQSSTKEKLRKTDGKRI